MLQIQNVITCLSHQSEIYNQLYNIKYKQRYVTSLIMWTRLRVQILRANAAIKMHSTCAVIALQIA